MRVDINGKKLVNVDKEFRKKLKPYKFWLTISVVMIPVSIVRFFITDSLWWAGVLCVSLLITYVLPKKMDKMIAENYIS